MSDNENLEEKSGTEELKQKPADHRPLIEKAAEAASDIEKASYKPFAGALDWAGSLVYAVSCDASAESVCVQVDNR